jgi:hypothetical protein
MNDRIHAHHHAVQFYGTDESLFNTVGSFISEGLIAGQPAVVIATPAHTQAILDELTRRLIDVAEARHIGDLVCMDAEECLATFMADNLPDPASFAKNVGEVIEQSLAGRTRTPVRAYGEMVDMLWKQKKEEAAIRLEILWNSLAETHSFQLLCGYSMGNFYKRSDRFEHVCQLHTHVLPADAKVVPFERRLRPRKTAVAV